MRLALLFTTCIFVTLCTGCRSKKADATHVETHESVTPEGEQTGEPPLEDWKNPPPGMPAAKLKQAP